MAENVATDQELLDRLKSDDDKAFRAIYTRYGKRCFGLALQKLSPEKPQKKLPKIFLSVFGNVVPLYLSKI